jgi:hypothetical protein
MKLTKEVLYVKERDEIMLKILNIINITKNNNKIKKEDLEKDEVRIGIRNLIDDIKKYYKTSNWRSMKTWKDKEINLINNVLKEHDIDILKIDKKRKCEDNKYHNYREYIFNINDELKKRI